MEQFEEDSGTRTQETEFVMMFIQDGIFHCHFKEIATMDLSVAQTSVKDRLQFFERKSYPSLFDITQVKQTTKEARDFLANEGNELVSASAIVVSSPMLRMIANFYIVVNKPKNPSQLFTDRESAVKWLSRFKARVQ